MSPHGVTQLRGGPRPQPAEGRPGTGTGTDGPSEPADPDVSSPQPSAGGQAGADSTRAASGHPLRQRRGAAGAAGGLCPAQWLSVQSAEQGEAGISVLQDTKQIWSPGQCGSMVTAPGRGPKGQAGSPVPLIGRAGLQKAANGCVSLCLSPLQAARPPRPPSVDGDIEPNSSPSKGPCLNPLPTSQAASPGPGSTLGSCSEAAACGGQLQGRSRPGARCPPGGTPAAWGGLAPEGWSPRPGVAPAPSTP